MVQANVFRSTCNTLTHGLCANLINALKLLACQQKDGDIVKDLGRESRKISQMACVNSQEWIRNTYWKSRQRDI